LASGDGNRNLREFTVNFGAQRASRCKANVAIKKGNKVVVSWPERFRRPKKLPSSAPPPPLLLHLSRKQNDEDATNVPQSVEWPTYRPVKYYLLSLVQKIRKSLEAVANPQIFHHCANRNDCWNMRRRKSGHGGKVSVHSQWDINQRDVSLPNRYTDEASLRVWTNSKEFLA
jgi:hypothetical protein